jgi:hypothetical protein
MSNDKHYYCPGKVDYNQSGRKNRKAYITWSLEDGRFSMSAEIWNPQQTGLYLSGQCVDTVAAYFPDDTKAQQMLAVWREWHLNDMKAGSPRQTAWLAAHPRVLKYDFTQQCRALKDAGLNPDRQCVHENGKPYSYGSAWLRRELPADVVAMINSWSEAD